MEATPKTRRSLKYIRLAAHLAGQPDEVDRIEMSFAEVEEIVGETLPANARFPSWWRNDDRRMHSRAWLSAGWEVARLGNDEADHVLFVRRG